MENIYDINQDIEARKDFEKNPDHKGLDLRSRLEDVKPGSPEEREILGSVRLEEDRLRKSQQHLSRAAMFESGELVLPKKAAQDIHSTAYYLTYEHRLPGL